MYHDSEKKRLWYGHKITSCTSTQPLLIELILDSSDCDKPKQDSSVQDCPLRLNCPLGV